MYNIKSAGQQIISSTYVSEVYIWIADAISGLVIITTFIALNINKWNIKLPENESLYQTPLILVLIVLGLIMLNVIGVLNGLVIDTLIDTFTKISRYLKKVSESRKWKTVEYISSRVVDFLSIPAPVSDQCIEYSSEFKLFLRTELNKYFKIIGNTTDLTKISIMFTKLNDKTIASTYNYQFSIYKSLITVSAIGLFILSNGKNYFTILLLTIIFFGSLRRIRNITIRSLNDSIEKSLLIIRDKEHESTK